MSAKMVPHDERPAPEFGVAGGWIAGTIDEPVLAAQVRSMAWGDAWQPPPASLVRLRCALVM